MPTEMLTYGQLGERLSCSAEAARALVKRLRLPRQKANDGKVLVSVDLTEINHRSLPARSSAGPHPVIAGLTARVDALQTELTKVEAAAAGHRADFEQERHRAEQLMSTASAQRLEHFPAALNQGDSQLPLPGRIWRN